MNPRDPLIPPPQFKERIAKLSPEEREAVAQFAAKSIKEVPFLQTDAGHITAWENAFFQAEQHGPKPGRHDNDTKKETPDWPAPIPFSTARATPDFKTELLPQTLCAMADALAIEIQTPTALTAAALLGAVATSVHRKVVVQVRDGWVEPVNLYLSVFLDPSNRKSPAFVAANRPLMDWEKERAKEVGPKIAEYKNKRANLQAMLKAKRRELSLSKTSVKGRATLVSETEDLARQLAALSEPRAPLLFVTDATDEALGKLLDAHGGAMAILSDEASIFKTMAGRYTKNDNPAFEAFLKGFSASAPLRVMRVTREPAFVDLPTVTVVTVVQESILHGVLRNPSFKGEGLTSRFAFLLPMSTLGSRTIGAPAVPQSVRDEYWRMMRALLDLEPGYDENGLPMPHVVHMNRDADEVVKDFERWVEPQLLPGAGLSGTYGFGGKIAGFAVRLSGIFHMVMHAHRAEPWSIPITAETVSRAVQLVREVFIPHGLAALSVMDEDENVERAMRIAEWVRRHKRTIFQRSEMHESLRRGVSRPSEWDGALRLLIECQWLREVQGEREQGKPGRPPTPTYEVNPALLVEGGAL